MTRKHKKKVYIVLWKNCLKRRDKIYNLRATVVVVVVSSGQRAYLLFQQSEFESLWFYSFNSVKMFEKDENKRKRGKELHAF